MKNDNNLIEEFPGSKTLDEIDVEYYDRVFLDSPNIHITDEDLRNDDIDTLIDRIINNSISAATAQGSANTKVIRTSREEYNSIKDGLHKYLKDLFDGLISGEPAITYRCWHTNECRKMIAMLSTIKDENGCPVWTYGNSQKVLNLTVKYFVVLARRLAYLGISNRIKQIGDIFINIIEEIDIPVDSFIEEASWNYNITHATGPQLDLPYLKPLRGKFIGYKVKAWSNWNEEDYITYVKSLHTVFTIPLNWEGYAWTEVKRARQRKKEQKKKEK